MQTNQNNKNDQSRISVFKLIPLYSTNLYYNKYLNGTKHHSISTKSNRIRIPIKCHQIFNKSHFIPVITIKNP